MTREITVAQLLSHRAGIAENYPRDLAAALRGPITEQRIVVARWLLETPAYPPGNYHYSNGGYVVIGSILERLGGKSWEILMRERVFGPLGMTSAGFGGTGTIGEIDQPWPHLANRHTPHAFDRPRLVILRRVKSFIITPHGGIGGHAAVFVLDCIEGLAKQLISFVESGDCRGSTQSSEEDSHALFF